jgi:hypothetical protein
MKTFWFTSGLLGSTCLEFEKIVQKASNTLFPEALNY